MSGLKSLFILNSTGDVIIEKHWRGMIARTSVDYFWSEVNKYTLHEEIPPVMQHSRLYLIHIQYRSIFFLAVCPCETPPLLVIDFLYRTIDVFKGYFEEVTEEKLKENFTVVYQVLEEMIDDGMPFVTELNILQDLIPSRGLMKDVFDKIPSLPDKWGSGASERLPEATNSIVPWRRVGVKYATNEMYLDIVEEVDCIIDSNQMMVTTEISGRIQANCKLSGMPDLTLTFVNPRLLDDVSLHPSVRYSRWEQSRVVSFIPPDGQFELMKYRVTGVVNLPFYCKPQIIWSPTGAKVQVMVGSKNSDKTIENVLITIPFPKTVGTANLTATVGSVLFDDVTKVCKWEISKIPRDSPMLTGHVTLQTNAGIPESKPTLLVDFKVPTLAVSGLKVDGLQVHNERYKPWKGVRSVTKAGKFQVRS